MEPMKVLPMVLQKVPTMESKMASHLAQEMESLIASCLVPTTESMKAQHLAQEMVYVKACRLVPQMDTEME